MCNLSVFLDMAAQFANLDPAFIMETLTRQITTSITLLPQIMKDIKTFTDIQSGGGISNYYEVGTALGRLFKIMFDFTI